MDTIAMYVGYIIIIGVALLGTYIAGLFVYYASDCTVGEKFKLFTFFGFGVLIVNNDNERLLANLRRLRKNDEAGVKLKNSTLFFNAPSWFNQYVWNIGGIKK